jgi:F-box/leucine-rich repeat protein 2/20
MSKKYVLLSKNIQNNIGTELTNETSFKLIENFKENILISLPFDVLRYFLNTWLFDFRNVCYLDSAFCNKKQRKVFINVLNEFITFGKLKCWDEKTFRALDVDTDLYLKWIFKRNIFLTNLRIDQWNNKILNHFNMNISNKNLFLKNLTCYLYDEDSVDFNEEIVIQILNSKIFKYLTELRFVSSFWNSISDLTLIAISDNCRNLKIFDPDSRNITDIGLISIAKNCLHLENIEIYNNKNITDLSLIAISNNCFNLQILNLDSCDQITDEGIIAISNNCINLKILILNYCDQITDNGIVSISNKCVNLEELSLNWCDQITDEVLIAISNNCIKLKILILNYCDQITDNGLISIAKRCLKIENISIFFKVNITDLSLIEISNNCKNLTVLNIGNCVAVTDNGVIAVTKKCLNLENLDISNNENVTDLSLIEISKNCTKHLKTLNVRHCDQITVDGVIAILKRCLNLEAIYISNNEIATDLRLIEVAKNNKKLKIN